MAATRREALLKAAQAYVPGLPPSSGDLQGYAQDVARDAAKTTMLVGAGGAVLGGAIAHDLLSEDTLVRMAQKLSAKIKVPVTVAMAFITGLFAAKNFGVPAGVLFGLSRHPDREQGPPLADPPRTNREARIRYMMGE